MYSWYYTVIYIKDRKSVQLHEPLHVVTGNKNVTHLFIVVTVETAGKTDEVHRLDTVT